MRSIARTGPALLTRRYAVSSGPVIPVLPPTNQAKPNTHADAIPPKLPPAIDADPVSGPPIHIKGSPASVLDNTTSDAAPFATEPIILEETIQATRIKQPRHRFRNTILATLLGGALVYGGGLYAALNNDTVYELYTEYLPYGEDLVLYVQEQEFRKRFPGAGSHKERSNPSRSTLPNVYIPRSGAQSSIRADPPTTAAKILQPGPQNSAIKDEDKATPGGATHAASANKQPVVQSPSSEAALKDAQSAAVAASKRSPSLPQRATSAKGPASTSTSALSRSPAPVTVQEPTNPAVAKAPTEADLIASTKPTVEVTAPVLSEPLKTFDIPKAFDRSIEQIQFAINGVIQAANEYGSSPFFRASLQNAQDEVIALNTKIAGIKAEEQNKSKQQLELISQQYGQQQQAQMQEVHRQVAEYQKGLANELEQERQRLNQAYSERLSEEVHKVEALSEQKLQNVVMEQAIAMQRKLNRNVKAHVEEEREGRLGKLEDLQKSMAELKQLNVDSSSFIDGRAKLQDLEIALAALKSVLAESRPRAFLRELAAVKELAGTDELLRATIDSIDSESYETGVPTLSQLSDRFRSVAEEVRKSALLPDSAGVAGHASSWILSKVMLQKKGMVPGSDVAAILARTEAHLEANDLDSATRELNQLKGWAKIISSDWLSMARRHLEVQQAVDLIEQSLILKALRTQ